MGAIYGCIHPQAAAFRQWAMQEEDNQNPALPDRRQTNADPGHVTDSSRTKGEENALHAELQRLVRKDFDQK